MSDAILPSLPGIYFEKRTPTYDTTVIGARTGPEYRIAERALRSRITMKVAFLRPWLNEDLILDGFFRSRRGKLYSFLIRDPRDYTVTDHGFGIGNGTSTKFRLQRALPATRTDALGTWDTYTKRRTNICLRSAEFANAAWATVPGGGDPSVTSNATIAPDGTLTADALGFSGSDNVFQTMSFTPAVGVAYTGSVWLKGTAGQTMTVTIASTGGTTDLATKTVTLTASWQRVEVTVTLAHGSHTGLQIILQRGVGNTVTTVYAWGAQVELSGAATAYIPTTSAAANADPQFWTADQTTGGLVAPTSTTPFDPVMEPDWPSITIYKDGVAQAPTTFTVGANGLVTFGSAPASGVALSWSGSYWHRVRFDEDKIDLQWDEGIYSGEIDLVQVLASGVTSP